MVVFNADKADARDIPEFISYEVIDLIEIKVPPKIQKQASILVLENLPSSHKPTGVEKLVRKHFDLPY